MIEHFYFPSSFNSLYLQYEYQIKQVAGAGFKVPLWGIQKHDILETHKQTEKVNTEASLQMANIWIFENKKKHDRQRKREQIDRLTEKLSTKAPLITIVIERWVEQARKKADGPELQVITPVSSSLWWQKCQSVVPLELFVCIKYEIQIWFAFFLLYI